MVQVVRVVRVIYIIWKSVDTGHLDTLAISREKRAQTASNVSEGVEMSIKWIQTCVVGCSKRYESFGGLSGAVGHY